MEERMEQKERMDGEEGLGAGRDRGLQLVLMKGIYALGEWRGKLAH